MVSGTAVDISCVNKLGAGAPYLLVFVVEPSHHDCRHHNLLQPSHNNKGSAVDARLTG